MVTIHMVSSLDGFIAKKDGNVSWLESRDGHYEKGTTLSQEEIEEYVKRIDCYIMGARTYEQALTLGWPYGDIPVVVLTHKEFSKNRDSVEFYSGDLVSIVNDKIKHRYKNTWMVGGSSTAKEFIRLNLVDKIILSIMPIILGDGILFFDFVGQEKKLDLKDVTAYKDGMVELTYEVIKYA